MRGSRGQDRFLAGCSLEPALLGCFEEQKFVDEGESPLDLLDASAGRPWPTVETDRFFSDWFCSAQTSSLIPSVRTSTALGASLLLAQVCEECFVKYTSAIMPDCTVDTKQFYAPKMAPERIAKRREQTRANLARMKSEAAQAEQQFFREWAIEEVKQSPCPGLARQFNEKMIVRRPPDPLAMDLAAKDAAVRDWLHFFRPSLRS